MLLLELRDRRPLFFDSFFASFFSRFFSFFSRFFSFFSRFFSFCRGKESKEDVLDNLFFNLFNFSGRSTLQNQTNGN